MARTLKKYYQSLLTSCGYAIAGGASAIFDKSSQLSGAHDDAFAVFISYRHCQPDRTWAKWLHKKLETYRVPKRLMQDRGMPRRIGRVFRDEEELAASPHLSVAIEEALQCSEYLVVICSPRTPSSKWVNKEIERFRAFGRGDHILALLIEGEPGEAFPLALCEIRPGLVDIPMKARPRLRRWNHWRQTCGQYKERALVIANGWPSSVC